MFTERDPKSGTRPTQSWQRNPSLGTQAPNRGFKIPAGGTNGFEGSARLVNLLISYLREHPFGTKDEDLPATLLYRTFSFPFVQ
jgi:hypothetical protein